MSGGEQGGVSGLLGLGGWWDNLSCPHSVPYVAAAELEAYLGSVCPSGFIAVTRADPKTRDTLQALGDTASLPFCHGNYNSAPM